MKKRPRLLAKVSAVLMSLFLVLVGCGNSNSSSTSSSSSSSSNDKKQYKMVLITMDSIDEHWLSVKAGAEAKAKELGNVQLTFRAPAGKTDPGEQVRMVEDAINQKADAILLAPSDQSALTPVVEKAASANIPVIVIDSPVKTDKISAFFATDNAKAASMAADKMAELIGQKGKIAIISAQPGAGTTMIREKGFKDRVAEKYPDIKIVTTQYCNGDKATALNQTMDILTANPDIVAFYATNEGSTVGVARGIKQKNVIGKVKVVGFDKSKDIINALDEGLIQATMVQNPYDMGAKGIQSAVDVIGKKTVEKKVDTGVKVVTKDNISEIKK